MVTAILLGGEWFPLVLVGLSTRGARDSGDARPKWAQTKTKTKRIGANVNAATLRTASHTVSTAVQITVDLIRPQRVDDGSYPQAVGIFAFRTLLRTQSCNYRAVIL